MINDYDTITYHHPSLGDDPAFEYTVNFDDVLYIIVQAIDNSTLDVHAKYIRKEGYKQIIECKYDIDPQNLYFTKDVTTGTNKGVVFYMKDENFNELQYDFKHILFRRYRILDITANMKENNGVDREFGPFNCLTNKTKSHNITDNRQRIGSGEASELEVIPKIFNGKFRSLWKASWTVGVSSLADYHQDYIINALKPYQRGGDYDWDAYLAWQTNNYKKRGISQPYYSGSTCEMQGQSEVSINKEDYKMRYTFDYNGQDASEMMNGGGRPLVSSVSMIAKIARNFKGYAAQKLPNTVFAFSHSCYAETTTYLSNITMRGTIEGNTVLLRSYNPSNKWVQVVHVGLGQGSGFYGNLIITKNMTYSAFDAIYNNYMNADISYVDVVRNFYMNVVIGAISKFHCWVANNMLIYGSHSNIKLEGATSWTTPYDGEYAYDSSWNDWVASSILAPFQYAKMTHHFNCNTFRNMYNKGFTIDPTNQYNSYDTLLWGTHIGYGNGKGVKYGVIARSSISACAFRPIIKTNSSNTEYFDDEQSAVPNLWGVDVMANYYYSNRIDPNLSEYAKSLIRTNNAGANGGIRYELVPDTTGKWRLFYKHSPTDIVDSIPPIPAALSSEAESRIGQADQSASLLALDEPTDNTEHIEKDWIIEGDTPDDSVSVPFYAIDDHSRHQQIIEEFNTPL